MVLARVDGAQERRPSLSVEAAAGVVAGRDVVAAEALRPEHELAELEPVVALNARIRRAAPKIFADEILDHVLPESLLES